MEFIVDNDQKAEWVISKIKEQQEEIEKWATFYDEQKRKAKENCSREIERLTGLLLPYFENVPKKETKTQFSYTLPSGKLVYKKEKQDFEKDEDVLLSWCKTNYNEKFVNVKESVNWKDLKEHIKNTGELPEGVTIVKKEAEFKVEGIK